LEETGTSDLCYLDLVLGLPMVLPGPTIGFELAVCRLASVRKAERTPSSIIGVDQSGDRNAADPPWQVGESLVVCAERPCEASFSAISVHCNDLGSTVKKGILANLVESNLQADFVLS